MITDALSGLQYAYEAEGKSKEALALIEKFITTKPDGSGDEELLLRKGDILFGQGEFGNAALEYQKIISLKPAPATKAKALYQLGRCFEMENNYPRAISYYEQARTEFPNDEIAPNVYLTLGYLFVKMKRNSDAIRIFKEFNYRLVKHFTVEDDRGVSRIGQYP